MTISNMLVTRNHPCQGDDDMFSDLEPISAFEVKKDAIATQLAALMAFSKKTRSEMATFLGWKKSRVTRVLSGKDNLTIQTIWDFASPLGFDFDVAFRLPNKQSAHQPWQISRGEYFPLESVALHTKHEQIHPTFNLQIQSAYEVAVALQQGDGRAFYVSMIPPMKGEQTARTLGSTYQSEPIPIGIDLCIERSKDLSWQE